MLAARQDVDVEVWPENWPAVTIFQQLGTQWNAGMGGAVGLRYEALYPLLDRKAKDADEWEDLFDDVRVLERAALRAMNEKD